jgi:hypothetical protein
MAIYSVFGLAAAVSGCTCFGYGSAYAVGTVVGFIAIGSFIGALLGQWVGIDESERDTHLYTQGTRMGAKLLAVRAKDELVMSTMSILQQENAKGVRTLED